MTSRIAGLISRSHATMAQRQGGCLFRTNSSWIGNSAHRPTLHFASID